MPARLRRWTSSAVPLLPKVRGSASSGPPTLLFDGMPTRLEADRVGLVCGVRSGLRGDRRDAPLLFAPMREEARQARPASSAARRRYWRACRVSSDRRAGSLDLPALLPPRGSLRAMAGRRRRSARPRAGSRPRRDPRSGERAARSPSVQQLERDRRGRDASARELTPATVEPHAAPITPRRQEGRPRPARTEPLGSRPRREGAAPPIGGRGRGAGPARAAPAGREWPRPRGAVEAVADRVPEREARLSGARGAGEAGRVRRELSAEPSGACVPVRSL